MCFKGHSSYKDRNASLRDQLNTVCSEYSLNRWATPTNQERRGDLAVFTQTSWCHS